MDVQLQPAAEWLQALPAVEVLRVSLWAYPLVSATHIAGFALLFGGIAVTDLRLLYSGRMDQAADRRAICVALGGFAIAVASGSALLAAKAVEYVAMSALWWKFAALAAGGSNALLLHGLARNYAVLPSLYVRMAAAISLTSWSGAILCGRLLGFL